MVRPRRRAGLTAAGCLVVSVAAVLRATAEPGSIEGRIADPLLARLPAAVYVEAIAGTTFPAPAEHPVIDQRSLVFIPHVLPVLRGTTVDFRNSDTVKHNIFSSRKSPTVFNLGTYGAGVVKSVTFDRPGVVTLLCNVHAEMSAYVVVVETPYFTVTDREGRFAIKGVPPGRYQLAFWHEILTGEAQAAQVESSRAAQVEWTRTKRR
jgi:plastocyanin